MNREVHYNEREVLCSLSQTLKDSQVLALYHAGRLPLYLCEETDETVTMKKKAILRTLRCRAFFAAGYGEQHVRTYYDVLFGGKDAQEAVRQMKDKKLRTRFICMHLGRMMQQGIFFAKTSDLVNSLGYKNVQQDTLARYIRLGKSNK